MSWYGALFLQRAILRRAAVDMRTNVVSALKCINVTLLPAVFKQTCETKLYGAQISPRRLPLEIAEHFAYITRVLRDYGHKRARNKRIGPGGGTRRLHQHPSFGDHGAETGSTNV